MASGGAIQELVEFFEVNLVSRRSSIEPPHEQAPALDVLDLRNLQVDDHITRQEGFSSGCRQIFQFHSSPRFGEGSLAI